MSTPSIVDSHQTRKGEKARHQGTPYARHESVSSPKGVGGDPGSLAPATKGHHHARQKSVSGAFSGSLISATEQEQTAFLGIYEILATKTIVEIVSVHLSALEEHRVVVQDVHPFSFAEFVLRNETLKEHLIIIRDSWDYDRATWIRKPLILAAEKTSGRNPWRETLEGFEEKVRDHKAANTLALEVFLIKLGSASHQDAIRGLVETGKGGGILNYILDNPIA